jgi:hypothetical protein
VPCYPAFTVRVLRDINVGTGKITVLGTIVLRFPKTQKQSGASEELEEAKI